MDDIRVRGGDRNHPATQETEARGDSGSDEGVRVGPGPHRAHSGVHRRTETSQGHRIGIPTALTTPGPRTEC